MTTNAAVQLVVFVLALVALAIPLGEYVARALGPKPALLPRVEGAIYRVAGVSSDEQMGWKQYAKAVLLFNALGVVALYVLQRSQHLLPLNPGGLRAVPPGVAFNTAVSFATNTNWQTYGGETTMSHLTQMLGLTTQNFVSAATGIGVLLALTRAFVAREREALGSFWVDLTRSTLYVLLPLSLIVALALVGQGVVQTFDAQVRATTLTGAEQLIAVGPAASQVAIKQLGTNGGGFFNVNSAHPFENPTPVTNLIELLSILLIPAALCFTFGAMVGDRRQGRAVFFAMLAIFIPLAVLTITLEQRGTPALAAQGLELAPNDDAPGGNMEGKELRFGVTNSALWAVATTAASNGSVNAMHDSFTPLGGLAPMWLIQLGEVVYGGVGSGLYGMLMYALIAVFVAGLMVGRTPEYLGKKIEAREMKMASLVILFPAGFTLVGTAVACVLPVGTAPLGNPGAHGFSAILYAYSSGANNNGSAFGGLAANGDFYASTIGAAMLVGRYWVIIPVLAIAGSLARKKLVPQSVGTLPTHTPLFIGLLIGAVLLVGALTFVPALALGPIAEHLSSLETP